MECSSAKKKQYEANSLLTTEENKKSKIKKSLYKHKRNLSPKIKKKQVKPLAPAKDINVVIADEGVTAIICKRTERQCVLHSLPTHNPNNNNKISQTLLKPHHPFTHMTYP